MWIFLNNAALSIVADRDKPNHLLVRARIGGDIERVFPGTIALTTAGAYYPFQASIPKKLVAAIIATHVAGIEYDDFESSVRAPRNAIYTRVLEAFRRVEYQPVPMPEKRAVKRTARKENIA